MELVKDIYVFSADFPLEEKFGLTSQLRRAATSVALNLAEGSGCESSVEFKRFINIALRSSYEVMCALEISQKIGFSTSEKTTEMLARTEEVAAMLTGLSKSLASS